MLSAVPDAVQLSLSPWTVLTGQTTFILALMVNSRATELGVKKKWKLDEKWAHKATPKHPFSELAAKSYKLLLQEKEMR